MKGSKQSILLFVTLGLCIALWLISRPFTGIKHDGILYALQALHIIQPEAFSHDIFFLNGSQDKYTLFTNIYAVTISLFGLTYSTLLLDIIGLITWLVAAFILLRILPTIPAIIALLLIVTLDSYYGSYQVFAYAEPFLTGRLYAEAFSLIALSAYLNRRFIGGTFAYAVAFLMHPLMALPALAIGLGIWLRPMAWLALLAVGGAAGIVLGMAGVPPFTGLTQPMDGTWWLYNVGRSPFVFLHTWTWNGFSQILFTGSITTTAWLMLSDTRLRRLAWAVLASVLLLLVISFVGASLLKLPLIISLQLHRVMWIAIVINPLLVTAIAWESRHASTWHMILAIGLGIGLLFDSSIQGGFAVAVALVSIIGYHYAPNYQPARWVWMLAALLPLQAVAFSILNLHMDAGGDAYISARPAWRIYMGHPLIALTLFTGLYWLSRNNSRIAKGIAIMTVAGLLGFAGWSWRDQAAEQFNSAAETFYDSSERQAAIEPIREIVPPNATVYWVEDPEKAWFWLHRANYVSFAQSAGSIFNHDTTIELMRRTNHVTSASDLDARNAWDSRPTTKNKQLTTAILQQLCQDTTLDYVIAKNYQADVKLLRFTDPETKQQYGLYTCRTNSNLIDSNTL